VFKIKFTASEVFYIIVSILVIAFVFGFDDKRESFEISYWFLNFLTILILVALSVMFREIVRKIIAKNHGSDATYDIWGMKRFWFHTSAYLPYSIPLGIILPILIAFLSNGQLFFVAAGTCIVSINAAYRIGRRFVKLTDYESAKIILAAPLASIFLAIVFKLLGGSAGIFNQFVLINSWLAITNMLPIPNLDGYKVLASSRPLFVLSFAFIILCVILLNYLGVFSTLLLASLLAIIILIVYYYFRVYE